MIKLNELFQITNNDEKHVVVDGNFYTVKNAPKPLHHYEWSDFPNSLKFLEVEDAIPDPVITPESEKSWVNLELSDFVNPMIPMFWASNGNYDGYEEKEVKQYAIDLGNYVIIIDGELVINGNRPVRPERHLKK